MFLDLLRKHWMLAGIALVCAWGYLYPAAGNLLGHYLAPMLACLMFLMGMGIGFRRFRSRMGSLRPMLLTMGLIYLVAPLMALLTGKLLLSGSLPLYTGIILTGTTATTLSTCVIFTRLAGGDEALALWLSVLSSLLCTFISPLLLLWLLGRVIEVPAALIMKRLVLVMFLPVSAGMLLRALLGEKRVAPVGPLLTRSCALIILAVIMVSVARGRDLLTGGSGPRIIAAATVFFLAMRIVTMLILRVVPLPRKDHIAAFFCAGEKTLQIPAYLAIEVLAMQGAALVPVVHHVFQLIVDSVLVSYFSSRSALDEEAETAV